MSNLERNFDSNLIRQNKEKKDASREDIREYSQLSSPKRDFAQPSYIAEERQKRFRQSQKSLEDYLESERLKLKQVRAKNNYKPSQYIQDMRKQYGPIPASIRSFSSDSVFTGNNIPPDFILVKEWEIEDLVVDASSRDYSDFKEFESKIDSYNGNAKKKEEAKEVIHNFTKALKEWNGDIENKHFLDNQEILERAIKTNPIVKLYLENIAKQPLEIRTPPSQEISVQGVLVDQQQLEQNFQSVYAYYKGILEQARQTADSDWKKRGSNSYSTNTEMHELAESSNINRFNINKISRDISKIAIAIREASQEKCSFLLELSNYVGLVHRGSNPKVLGRRITNVMGEAALKALQAIDSDRQTSGSNPSLDFLLAKDTQLTADIRSWFNRLRQAGVPFPDPAGE